MWCCVCLHIPYAVSRGVSCVSFYLHGDMTFCFEYTSRPSRKSSRHIVVNRFGTGHCLSVEKWKLLILGKRGTVRSRTDSACEVLKCKISANWWCRREAFLSLSKQTFYLGSLKTTTGGLFLFCLGCNENGTNVLSNRCCYDIEDS